VGYSIVAVLIIIFLGVVIYNSGREKEVGMSPTSGAKEVLKYSGYIIQFTDDPIIKKKVELEKTKGVKLTSNDPDLKSYKATLDKNHESIRNKILSYIDSRPGLNSANKEEKEKILGDYKTVFNGIALNVSDSEAQDIKKISGVKEVSKNYEDSLIKMEIIVLQADNNV